MYVCSARIYPQVRSDYALNIMLRYEELEKKSFLFKSAEEKRRDKEKESIVKQVCIMRS